MAAEPKSCFLGVAAIIASAEMRRTMELVELVARTSASVLVIGETGSGKEIVARAIHHYSDRASKPWVDINCGAMPEHLMESELFGHEKGAFSGADTARPGLFEMAHTGTLFLDEVGELEPRMQVKLLRVLDGSSYYRVGGTRKVSVNTRIVAATNQDMERAVREGRFRGDLYHRLNQYQLRVPPLRERRDDIVPIARYLVEQQGRQASFSKAAEEALRAWNWPGNVRELRNVVTKALINSGGAVIDASDLSIAAPVRGLAADGSTGLSLNGLEQHAIVEALRTTGGRCKRAADLLGISRRTLSRKLKQYGPSVKEESSLYEHVTR
jgi:DNA-binding NtrC family response regulator